MCVCVAEGCGARCVFVDRLRRAFIETSRAAGARCEVLFSTYGQGVVSFLSGF